MVNITHSSFTADTLFPVAARSNFAPAVGSGLRSELADFVLIGATSFDGVDLISLTASCYGFDAVVTQPVTVTALPSTLTSVNAVLTAQGVPVSFAANVTGSRTLRTAGVCVL